MMTLTQRLTLDFCTIYLGKYKFPPDRDVLAERLLMNPEELEEELDVLWRDGWLTPDTCQPAMEIEPLAAIVGRTDTRSAVNKRFEAGLPYAAPTG